MKELIPVVAIIFGCGIPISAIWTTHRRQILEMQLRLRNEGNASLQSAVEALRAEVHSLRDTSMQYDLSFDTALQRMEQRVANLERRSQQSETEQVANLRVGV